MKLTSKNDEFTETDEEIDYFTRMKVIKAKRKQETLITSFTFSNEIEIYLKCFLFYVHVYI